MRKCFSISIVMIAFVLANFANAAPSFSGYLPANNSYFGRGNVNFYVNVTSSSLDYVKLFIISEDAYRSGEPWDAYTMQCVSWNCTKSVSFAIAGADTLEFFYFEANDSGGISRLGYPGYFQFKIDRNPPVITFVRPVNGSFVSGNVTVEVTAVDSISGVNASSFQFSLDNSTWSSMPGGIGYFNSSVYQDNQTITIYVRASDNLNNSGTAAINATVDNELPRIAVTSHQNGATIKDTVSFVINVIDPLSGIGGAKIRTASSDTAMTCSGSKNATCAVSVNTKLFPDNEYNITFIANDTAGNLNSTNLSVTINNNRPSVTLAPEGYVKGTVAVSASLYNPGSIITGVRLSVEKTGYSSNVTMSCNSQYTSCSYSLNTLTVGDGTYTLTANASNILNHTAVDTATLVADNTKPVVGITGPASAVASTFTISATVTDTNFDRTQVSYSIVGSGTMSCVVAASDKLLCEAPYDPAALSNGNYALTVTAIDAAGNSGTSSKTITVSKAGSGGGGTGSSGSSGSPSGAGNGSSTGGTVPGSSSSSSGSGGCGDSVCSLSETCSSCPADCGVCSAPGGTGTPGGGSGGSGDGISSFITSNPLAISVIGIALVAAGLAVKMFRKRRGTAKPKQNKESKKKEDVKPFIFGEK